MLELYAENRCHQSAPQASSGAETNQAVRATPSIRDNSGQISTFADLVETVHSNTKASFATPHEPLCNNFTLDNDKVAGQDKWYGEGRRTVSVISSAASEVVASYAREFAALGAKAQTVGDDTIKLVFRSQENSTLAHQILQSPRRGVDLLFEPPVGNVRDFVKDNWTVASFAGKTPGLNVYSSSRSIEAPYDILASVKSQTDFDHLRPLLKDNGDYPIRMIVKP